MNTQNTNFAFPLAIEGTHDELRILAKKLIALGYEWFSNIKLFEPENNYLVTNFFDCNGRLGTLQGAGDRYRRLVSLSTHSEACILALAAARADGVFCDGEYAYRIKGKKLEKCIWITGRTPEDIKLLRRPTFEEIVNHFAAKEQFVAEPSRPTAPAKDIEFTGTPKEWFELVVDEKLRAELLWNNKSTKDLFESLEGAIYDGFVWKLTPQEHDYWAKIHEQADTIECYVPQQKTEPAPQPAPEPTLLDHLKSGVVDKVFSEYYGVSSSIQIINDEGFPILVKFPGTSGEPTFTKNGKYYYDEDCPERDIHPYVEQKPFLMESNPTGEDAKTYYEAGEMVQATLQAEIDRLKKEMADMLETQQQAAREWNERECVLVGTINELRHEQKSTDRTIQRLEEQAGQFDSEYLRLQRAFDEAMSIIDGFRKLTDTLK